MDAAIKFDAVMSGWSTVYVLRKVKIWTIPYSPAQSENSYFGGQSENSYFAPFNSGIVSAQSGNRDKVRLFIDLNVNMSLNKAHFD